MTANVRPSKIPNWRTVKEAYVATFEALHQLLQIGSLPFRVERDSLI
jgi:hypothetical protein